MADTIVAKYELVKINWNDEAKRLARMIQPTTPTPITMAHLGHAAIIGIGHDQGHVGEVVDWLKQDHQVQPLGFAVAEDGRWVVISSINADDTVELEVATVQAATAVMGLDPTGGDCPDYESDAADELFVAVLADGTSDKAKAA